MPDCTFPLPLAIEEGIPIPSGFVLDDADIAPVPVNEEKMEKVL